VELDHISAPVRDLRAARKFYGAALGAIGMKVNMDVGSASGWGSGTDKVFWLTPERGALARGRTTAGTIYAAFVKDLEGDNIEVVCYAAPKRGRARSGARPARLSRRR
jgi:catechol 2,3-dioxygenase-like lactoylglutathione lyase family enzyme